MQKRRILRLFTISLLIFASLKKIDAFNLEVDGCSSLNFTNKCKTCKDGLYSYNGGCNQCISSCKECSQTNTCQVCEDGFKLNENKICILNCSTINNCMSCENLT